MRTLETIRKGMSQFDDGGSGSPAGRATGGLRARVARRLRQETLSAVVIAIAMIALFALAVTDSLPSLRNDYYATSFIAGFLMGLFGVAEGVTLRKIVEMRRALADDAALRRLRAIENDELREHLERETARTFVQMIPALSVVAIFAGALVSLEAMAAVAATLVFLALALLGAKVYCKARYRAEEADSE